MKLYYAVYRTGGRDNCKWTRTMAMTHDEAIKAAAEIERGGRKAFVQEKSAIDAIGLPEGWEYTPTH